MRLPPKQLKKSPTRTIVVATDRAPGQTIYYVVARSQYLGAFETAEQVTEAIKPHLTPEQQRDEVRMRHLIGYAEQFRVGVLDVTTDELTGDYYDIRGWFPQEVVQDLEDAWLIQAEHARTVSPQGGAAVKPFRGFGSWVPQRRN